MSQPLSVRQIWGMPIVLAIFSAVGLLSALLGDGIWDVLSWIALAAPIAAAMWSLSLNARVRNARGRNVVIMV